MKQLKKPNSKTIAISVAVAALAIITIVMIFSKLGKGKFTTRDYPEIQDAKVLHIVTNIDPVGYFVAGDTIVGFTHDLLLALQQYTDVKFDISVENNLDKSLAGLNNGTYDLVARNIPINASVKDAYSFTEPVMYNKLILVQRKTEYNDSIPPIRNHLQLAKKTVHVPNESPFILRIDNLSREIGDTIYVVQNNMYDADQLAMMVADGEIDFAVCDEKTAIKLAAVIPQLDIKTDIGFTHLEGWAVRSTSPALLDSLNTWIARFKQTKSFQRISNKYL